MTIWTLGDAVVDLLPLENRQYEACAGGAPLNVAVGASMLGQKSGFIGRVGRDDFGLFLRETLALAGVDTQHIEIDEHRHTSTVLVSLDKHGDRQFDFLVNPSADQFLSQQALPQFDNDILHFCSLALVAPQCRQTLQQAVAAVRTAKGLVSFDLNVRSQMWSDEVTMRQEVEHAALDADILKMSEEEWLWLTRTDDPDLARLQLDTFPAGLKIVTQGERGALVFWRHTCFSFSGYQVDSVDTTGAGDAFAAGLLAGLAEHGWPDSAAALAQRIEQACACGALATTQKGALTAMPTQHQLNKFILQRDPLQLEVKP